MGLSRRLITAATALATALAATLLVLLGATHARAATTTLCSEQTATVGGGTYIVQNNEYDSSASECVTTDGNADFTVANSSIANATDGSPGAYPSIYQGCHWGSCSSGGLTSTPIEVSKLTSGAVTTSWSTTQPGGSSAYDVAYDIWFNKTPTTTGQPNCTELMVWLNHNGSVQPFGSQVASGVSVGGHTYNIWEGAQSSWNTISYSMTSGTTSVSNLDVGTLAQDAVSRGYLSSSCYLIDVEAGFELWRGGAGLATKSFSVKLNGSSPVALGSGSRNRRAAPSPASPSSISLQAVSPATTTPGTATNATVDFANTGSAKASDETVTVKVLNSAGTVVGSQSWAGQDIAPQEKLSETYTWRAAAPAGTYTVEGIVQDSGKTLQQARVGTVTVN